VKSEVPTFLFYRIEQVYKYFSSFFFSYDNVHKKLSKNLSLEEEEKKEERPYINEIRDCKKYISNEI